MGNEREGSTIEALRFEARPIDVGMAFAKELATARWVLAAMAQGGGVEGMMVAAAADMIGETLSAMVAVFGEEAVGAVLLDARDEFERRLANAFPEGKAVSMDEAEVQKEREQIRRENEARIVARRIARQAMADPGKPVA